MPKNVNWHLFSLSSSTLVTAMTKLLKNCQAIEFSFRDLREALDELLQHAFLPPSLWLCTFPLFFAFYHLLVTAVDKKAFKLSDNCDFLQEPSGSTWRAIPGERKEILHQFFFLKSTKTIPGAGKKKESFRGKFEFPLQRYRSRRLSLHPLLMPDIISLVN